MPLDEGGRYPLARVTVPQGRPPRRRRPCGQHLACRPDDPVWVPPDQPVGALGEVNAPFLRSLSFRHGTPSTEVSSCTPPESVSTGRADASSAMKSRYRAAE